MGGEMKRVTKKDLIVSAIFIFVVTLSLFGGLYHSSWKMAAIPPGIFLGIPMVLGVMVQYWKKIIKIIFVIYVTIMVAGFFMPVMISNLFPNLSFSRKVNEVLTFLSFNLPLKTIGVGLLAFILVSLFYLVRKK